jgi:uncharacterized protein (TIGR04255 family)
MLTHCHLPNAPISEAIIDIRIKPIPDFNISEFKRVAPKIFNHFPESQKREKKQITFQWPPSDIKSINIEEPEALGYFFRNKERDKIAQFRIDGFSFNKIKAYTSWQEIFPEALSLWNLYIEILKPEVITRLATRYINQIRIPGETVDFDKYFRLVPQIPSELPQLVPNFFSRVTILNEEKKIFTHITQTFEQYSEKEEKGINYLLDIDSFYINTSKANLSNASIEEIFSILRNEKNNVFFSLITEETLRLFK